MSNELIVKDNILINASYNLEVTEQRLILLSIVRARETQQGITAESKLTIHASDYMNHFKVDKSAAYEALKGAVQNLFNRQFSFKEQQDDGTEFVVKSRWVSQIAYADEKAELHIIFAPAVVPLVTRLEKHFTSYQLKQVSQLSSKYAIRLYEILIAWRDVGKTPLINVDDLRYRLGVEATEYKRMSDFKKRVLEPAITQINTYTDIDADYEQFKDGRIISGVKFTFKEKIIHKKLEVNKNKDNDTPDLFFNLTEKQVSLFAKKLAYDNEFSSQFADVGESYIDLESRLVSKIKEKGFIESNIMHFNRIGIKI
ncbi:replication initiation protein [Acinetobacter sp. B5B]|uniref:replication initiation protein RepM n=1 Tax=Acinetobacter baretiae TaxID=2605383 RepID=UPI0018C2992D|nr:replication initiation protein RepM [Acinetobacter baretiae]MBF7683895.1 replication initiation protein [Acinetobacter baretiae]